MVKKRGNVRTAYQNLRWKCSRSSAASLARAGASARCPATFSFSYDQLQFISVSPGLCSYISTPTVLPQSAAPRPGSKGNHSV